MQHRKNRSTSSSLRYSRRAGPRRSSNLFCGLLLLLTILEGMRRLKTATTPTTERVTRQTKGKVSEFNAFQREYLAVYFVIMLADWLQGTNMYTLYLIWRQFRLDFIPHRLLPHHSCSARLWVYW